MSDLPTTAKMALAQGVPVRNYADWEVLAAKVVNRGRSAPLEPAEAARTLRSTTSGGQAIAPLYTATDAQADQGWLGSMPFTRGARPRDPQQPWDVRAWHEDPDVRLTRAAITDDLAHGVTSVWLQLGDGSLAAGDLPTVLSGVDLQQVAVALSAVTEQAEAARQMLAVMTSSGVPAARLAGSLGIDPIGAAAVTGATADLAALPDVVRSAAEYPAVQALTVDGRIWHDAGAGDGDQVALAVATGITYVRQLVDAGLSADEAFAAIEFRVAVSDEQFGVIAALRALRRLWARVGEVVGVTEARRGARVHAVTSWRMQTATDPWVNLLRDTIACFAAAAGGADAITVLPFDVALGLSEPFSRRLARNTAHLLAFESNVARVNDPAGGAWFVESLTDQLAHDAWARVQQIESLGGMDAALRDGSIADWLGQAATHRAEQVACLQLPLTGTSTFPPIEQAPVTRRPRTTAKFNGLARHRDSEPFETLRARAANAPTVRLACVGSPKEVGRAQTAASNLLAVAGIPLQVLNGDSATQALPEAPPGTVALLDINWPLPARDADIVEWLSGLLDQIGVPA